MNVLEKTPFIPGPIASAGNIPLSESSSGQPVMAEAILDWFRPITIGVVTAAPQGSADPAMDGVVKETIRSVRTSGCYQAGKGEKLDIQAGGERSWQTGILHCTPDFNVSTDTILIVAGTRFRIVVKADRTANGFVRYELIEDYARTS